MYFVDFFSSLEGQNYACSKINPKYILDKVMEDKMCIRTPKLILQNIG